MSKKNQDEKPSAQDKNRAEELLTALREDGLQSYQLCLEDMDVMERVFGCGWSYLIYGD